MIRERSFSHTGGVCCQMGQHRLSWQELHERAAALAAMLERYNGAVLIYGEKSPEYVAAIAGCLWAGLPYVPVGPHIPAFRIASMIKQAQIKAAVCLSPLPGELCGCFDCLEMPQAGNTHFALRAISPEDTAYILFTSGSTGMPKGVAVSYQNIENFIEWFSTRPAIAGLYPRAVLNQAQFSFDLSVADLYYALYTGCTLELQQENTRLSTAGSRAELAVMTPSYADFCLMDTEFKAAMLPCLQTVFFCGEPLRCSTVRRLWSRFPGLRIINAYGPTEATCAVCSAEITPDLTEATALPIGMEAGEAVQITIGSDNRIYLQGKSVAVGYLNGEVFEGCFAAGDIGHYADGYLWFDGRCDDQIKYKGYRIEPYEIEAALAAQPGIRQAVVLPRKDPTGRVISLYALVTAEGAVQEQALREALRSTLPDYMIPKQIRQCEELPMTQNGKIDRRKAGLI